jgi:pyruvate dehydrogenase E2 component (dihydrolipoamide acetyltransferase)
MGARREGERVFASPLARRLAADRGVRLENIRGSGPNGRIIADDVEHARAEDHAGAAAVRTVVEEHPLSKFFPEFEDTSVSAIKRVTAQRLTESKQQVPHFYLTVDIRMDKCMDIRQTLNKQLADDKAAAGAKISVNDFIVKASAKSLLAVPDVNASWLGDKIRKYKKADISVAVQTERGLMVPIVRSACCLGLKSISSEVKALAGRAREGSLTPQDMTGGTFTISNLGMFGVKSFAAIVNPPQAAILAVGGTRKEVVKTDAGYEEVLVMSATLSCDHRVVDGAVGAQWLAAFKGYLEDPMTMLL